METSPRGNVPERVSHRPTTPPGQYEIEDEPEENLSLSQEEEEEFTHEESTRKKLTYSDLEWSPEEDEASEEESVGHISFDRKYLEDEDEEIDGTASPRKMSLSELLSQQESRPTTATVGNSKSLSRPATSSAPARKIDFGSLSRELEEELANM